MPKFKKAIKPSWQSGQASRALLILAIVILVAAVITYLVMKMAEKPKKPVIEGSANKPVLPVYEQQLGKVRVIFESAIDFGSVLKASDIPKREQGYYSYGGHDDVVTTERFIMATIGAQNKGKVNTERGSWGLGNIVDSEGRNFEPVENSKVNAWIPKSSDCGAMLKPEFDPIPCTKIYEVSKASSGLKVEVKVGKNGSASNYSSDKVDAFLMDLIVK